MDWIGSALNLTVEDLDAGFKRLDLGNGEWLDLECVSDVPVKSAQTHVFPTLEQVSALKSRETPASVASTSDIPRETADASPFFMAAVTTIRDYLIDRDEYVKKHILHMVDHFRDPGSDATREMAQILGNAYHRIMELHPDLDDEAESSGLDSMTAELAAVSDADRMQLSERFKEMVARTRQWPLREAFKGNQGFHELPFNIYLANGIVHGIIDLLIQIDGRWHVVDYKTDRKPDRIGLDEWMARHRDEHRFQMSVYALAVRQIDPSNREDIPVIVYFADSGAEIRFEFTAGELDRLEQSLDVTLKVMAQEE